MIGYQIDNFYPGDLVLLGPHLPHAWHNFRQEGAESVQALTLFIRPDYPSKAFYELPDNAALADVLGRSHAGLILNPPIREKVAAQLQALVGTTGPRRSLGILAILAAIAEARQTRPALTEDRPGFQARRSPRIEGVLHHIFEHLDEPLSSRELAGRVGMHPSALGRLFRRSTGCSLIEFINRARVTRACRLLGDERKAITEVAFEVGFQNLSHFNRMFKRYEGRAPSAYRRGAARSGVG
jgi:AraC-like DNA-binding protein